MRAIVINLYGGPCCGKSTVSAGLFYELKCLGVECELTGEYAKDNPGWRGCCHSRQSRERWRKVP